MAGQVGSPDFSPDRPLISPSLLTLRTGFRRARSLAFVAGCALALSVCGREPTGPRVGEISGTARFILQPDLGDKGPLFQAAGLQVDRIHIVIRGADGTIVFERDVVFPAGQGEVSITADVPVHGETERFRASYELFSGTIAMFTGMVEVTGRPGVTTTTPSVVPTTFVGPGATATRVDVSPASSTLLAGTTTSLTATAFDNANAAIVGTPFVWSSSNPTVATVSPAGLVTAGNTRGTTTISASTISGVTGSATVGVSLPAARIIIVSGDAQTGRAGQALAAPIVFEVQASDGVAIPNAAMTFAVVTGGGSVSPAGATSGATGRASMTPTLGGTLGAQTFRATTGAITATATATATPGVPAQITIVSGNTQTDSIGRQLLPFVVKASDTFGNVTPGATIAWARTLGSGTLSAPTSATDAQGQAQIVYTLGNSPGSESVTATLPAPSTGSVTFTAIAIARQTASLTIVSGNSQTGTVGQAAAPLVVQARDALGNPVGGVAVNWSTSGGGTLSATSALTNAQGQAQITYTHASTPGSVTVTARLASNPNIATNFTLGASVGAAASLQVAAGGGQSAMVGTAVATAPSVRVLDALGNAIAGASVTFTPSAGGSVTGSPSTTDASGVATVGSWTLGATAGPQTLTATSGPASVSISATATAPVGPNTLSITTQPSVTVQNTGVFAQQPVIQLRNAAGAPLATSGVVVTVSVQSGTASLRGTLTATTDASGVATFAGLSVLGATGNITLGFSAGGFTGVTSGTMTIIAGPAVYLAATTATAINSTVGFVVSPNPQVIVKDSSNNPVSGVFVTFATPAPGNGLVTTGTGSTTGASGNANPTLWTLDNSVGADTMTATVAGLVGSPVTFVATTSAGAATQLVIVSGNGQTGTTGTALASPMIVIAKDALNNPVSGISIGFSVTAGGGTPASQIIATNAGGQSSFTLTLGPPGAQTVQACLPGCTATASFTATSIPVGANATWTGATSTDWSVASNWSPASVPNGSNSVFIPNGTPNSPVLSSTSSVGDIAMASGAALNVGAFNLNVSGNVANSGASLSGTGYFYFCGGTHTVVGATAGLVADCGSTINASGTVTIGPGLSVFNNSDFVTGAADVAVTGNMDVLSNALLTMTTVGGHLLVTGNVTFQGGDENGRLTDGLLDVGGNFIQNGSNNSQSFRATSLHTTRFVGAGGQSVSFTNGGYGCCDSWFQNFAVAKPSGSLTFSTFARIAGAFNVSTATAITAAAGTVDVAGQVTSAVGSNLTGISALHLNGGGAIFPLISGSAPAVTRIYGAYSASGSITFPGNLEVHGSLNANSANLIVQGNFSTFGSGYLQQQSSGFKVTVTGHALFQGGDENNQLTDGTLEIGGNFTQSGSNNSQSFRAVGNHLTRFNGSVAQTVTFSNGGYGCCDSWFQNVQLSNTSGGVTFTNFARIAGSLGVTTTTPVVAAAASLDVAGAVTAVASSNLSGISALHLNGGPTFPVLGGSAPTVTRIYGAYTQSGTLTFPGHLEAHNALTVTGALTVQGNFATQGGGYVRQLAAGSTLSVTGNVTFNGADENNSLIDGVLEVAGNFTQTGSNNSQSFRAIASHLTRLNGSGAQSVSFSNGGYGCCDSWFQNLEVAKSGGAVTLSTFVRVAGTFNVTSATSISSGTNLDVAGQVTTVAGSNLSGLASLQLNGGGSIFPIIAGVAPPITRILGAYTQTGTLTFPGNLETQNALTVSGVLMVQGNFATQGSSGYLRQVAAGSKLTVTGNALFNGADENNSLTEGVLEIAGNFTQTGSNSSQSYRSTSNHLTRFNGGAAQTISFANGGYGCCDSWFQHVQLSNTAGGVTFNTFARITGTLDVATTTPVISSGSSLDVAGAMTAVAGSNLSGIPALHLNGGPTFPVLGGSAPTVTRLYGAYTETGTLTFPGNLEAHNQLLVSGVLTVQGNFATQSSSGYLRQVAAGSKLTVTGNATFNGGDENGHLTEGVLEVAGNFTQTGSNNSQSFRATANHTTRLNGSGAQGVSFSNAGYGCCDSWFQSLEVTKSGGSVGFGSFVRVAGAFNVASATGFSSSSNLDVAGQVTTVAGSNLSSLTSLQLNGGGAIFPVISGVAPPVTRIYGAYSVSGTATFPGNLEVHGSLNASSAVLTVQGNLSTQGSGSLVQQSAGSKVTVSGIMAFNGGDENGNLTDGVLEVAGNFTQTGTNHSQSFRGTSNHLVRLNGSGAQTISFSNGGYGCCDSWFNKLEVTNNSGSAAVSGFARVAGTMNLVGKFTIPLSQTLDVNGALTLQSGSVFTKNGTLNLSAGCTNLGGTPVGFSCP